MSMRRAPAPDGALLSPSWSSSFSSKCNVHQMLESPIASPALPSIVPRHGKKPKSNHTRKILRWLLPTTKWLCGMFFIGWLLTSSTVSRRLLPIADNSSIAESYNIIGEDISAEAPMPILLADPKGGYKFTISLPPNLTYPLRPSAYNSICSRSNDFAHHLQHQISHSGLHQDRKFQDYHHANPSFLDIEEAEEHEILPIKGGSGTHSSQQLSHTLSRQLLKGGRNFEHEGTKSKICEKSLTYVLETADAGIGKTLMGLWLSFGLAKEEGRAFFIDDSNWSFGKYNDLFKPPPLPSCMPAPAHHRLPCPHHARHLLISTSTSQWTFGQAFKEKFQSSKEAKRHRQEGVFSLIRTGYEALFHFAPPDAAYAKTRLAELERLRSKGSRVVGLHVRRGDRHPWEHQYQDSYIPLETYLNTANDFITREFHPNAANSSVVSISDKPTAELESAILLASDDPDIYSTLEVRNTHRAQTHISLANKAALDAASPASAPRSSDSEVIFNKFVEGNVGWEGGFFPSVFWGLGNAEAGSLAARGLRAEREDPPPTQLSLSLRGLVARAYLLDLKILGASDAVVCGVSSIGCRLLGVMLGWQKGIVEGQWKNIDGGFGWTAFDED